MRDFGKKTLIKKYKLMKKEEVISAIGKPILNPLGTLQLISILFVISSPFLCIWFDFVFALKIFLSGLFGVILFTCAYKFIENIIKEEYEKEFSAKKETNVKSKF